MHPKTHLDCDQDEKPGRSPEVLSPIEVKGEGPSLNPCMEACFFSQCEAWDKTPIGEFPD